ncbi:PDR/VanB family oxidoreductase [Coralliovum pocilloporae]|uniref:PDR/VanB family oxidoreductase n=1 Tax=Coralliovum pocilloporae TaxID=3066369 RepID=UPI0033076B38
MSAGVKKLDVAVTEITEINSLVKRFRFESPNGHALPTFSGGSHVVVEMHDGDIVRRNPYSLMSSPLETASYTISVRRDDEGRGGSLFMHNRVKVGDRMTISTPVNLFGLDLRARKHLLLAGGIGITPFIAQMAQLQASGAAFELHYSSRSAALSSYADVLQATYGDRVSLYRDDQDQMIDLKGLLSGQPLGTHVYVCGPEGMINAVRQAAEQAGWSDHAVHFEHFLAPPTGKPFQVHLERSGITIEVSAQQSLLEAIEAAGVDAPFLCRGGACGQCETAIVSCDGTLEHNDHWLSDEERAAGSKIMPCVSRFDGSTLTLDR